MRGGWVPLVSLLALLAACQPARQPSVAQTKSIEYREPASEPRTVPAGSIAGTPRDLIDGALTQLNDDRFEVSLADADRGLFILTYTGSADEFLDCGEFRLRGDDPEAWRDTATRQITLSPFQRYPDWVANREMRLDARVVTQLRPAAGATDIKTDTFYVLTQLVDIIDNEGVLRGTTRETIDFNSGQSGRFAKGTRCNPNGELERQVASLFSESAETVASNAAATPLAAAPEPAPTPEAPTPDVPIATAAVATRQPPRDVERPSTSLDCADVDVARSPTRGIVLTGVVANDDDRQALIDETRSNANGDAVVDELALLPPGGCDAIELARLVGTSALPQFSVKLEGNANVLSEGSTVDLDVTLPGSNRYFYVGYIQEDGVIHHLGPKFIDGDSVGERFLFRTGYEVVPPFGPELILVIASRDPIFSEPRPSAEQATSYLRALRARLVDAPQADAVAETLTIVTKR